MRANLIFAMIGCAIAVPSVGCLAPGSAPFSRNEASRNRVAPVAAAPAAALPNSSSGADLATADMSGVLDKLEQVRAIDPAAEQKLLAELRRTPANSWPLVAEQFRASLAYHQQLAAKEAKPQEAGEPLAEFRRAPSTNAVLETPRSTPIALTPPSLASNPPSAPIGALVDPHGANSEGATILAQSLPYALPSPIGGRSASSPQDLAAPAEFAGNGPMYPIAAQTGVAAEPAVFQTPAADAVHAATQALARMDSGATGGQSAAQQDSKQLPTALPSDSSESKAGENWQQLVKRAAADLSQRVVDSPTTTAEVHQHVSLRMLRLLSGDTEKALEPIPHISPAEQDYWSRQLFALATYLDHHSQPDDKRRAAASVAHLDEAVSHLRELGALSLRNLSFCKNVYGYGAIETYESDLFTPGQQVSLYVEAENYHSTSSEKGFCTSLGATYELLDDKGKRVSGGEFPDVEDCCRSRRRDFHIQFGLTMPENLAPGRYRVELVVKDRQCDKLGHATAAFEIRSGKK